MEGEVERRTGEKRKRGEKEIIGGINKRMEEKEKELKGRKKLGKESSLKEKWGNC